MRLITDENFPLTSAKILREAGHDVAAIPEDEPGEQDELILERAVREKRIVVTFDRDFGELVFYRGSPRPPGIIYLRFEPKSPSEPAERLLELFSKIEDWENCITVVERWRVRSRIFG